MNQEILQTYLRQEETPAYIFDLDMLKSRVQMMKTILGERAEICFAMKANPFLIGPLKDTADKFEVCSPGEFHICETVGIPMERIVLSGVNKEKCDITHAMHTYGNAGVYTIESRKHLELLEMCAKEENITIHALIRVTSGNQFGIDEEEVFDIVSQKDYYSHVRIEGIQCYSGTQKKKFSKIEKELHWLDDILTRLKETCDYDAEVLEYGPGFYIPYFENEDEVDDESLLQQFADTLATLKFQGKITLEMGRYIAAYCGYYVTRIVDQKVNHGQNYCIVDGGLNHLNYYGQAMAMKQPYLSVCGKETEPCTESWNICGSLCSMNDIIAKQISLPDIEIGDVICFENTGAYCMTEGISLFLSRDIPSVYIKKEDGTYLCVRDSFETFNLNKPNYRKETN